jgi:hypothetical protein
MGNIGGKELHFTARPAKNGAHPPPGHYQIHPPTNDPIYGMVALMTPLGPQVPSGAKEFNADKFMPSHAKFAPVGVKDSPVAGKFAPPAYDWIKAGKGKGAVGVKERPGTLANHTFVLSSRPILGQNSLVVMVGFADLMDALQAAGGASVTVG